MTQRYQFPCGCSFPIIEESSDPDQMPLIDFRIEDAPDDCKATWELLGKGLTKGVFQLESSLGRQWSKRLKPESSEHLSALSAILRPGCLKAVDDDGVSMTQHYCRRKNNEEETKPYHPAVDPILSKTYNVMVYQEQAMAICRAVAGFSLQDADRFRKAASKKDSQEMAICRQMFLDGARKACIVTDEIAKQLFDWMQESQRYLFNASHAMCYGLTGYESAYLKAHFPLAFFLSWLDQAKNKQDPQQEIYELVNDAKLFDVAVAPPDLRDLEPGFSSADRKSIRFGLADIKGVGDAQVTKTIAAIRRLEGEIGKPLGKWTWLEFLTRCSSSLTSSVVDRLIKVGALGWFGLSRQRMLAEYEAWSAMTDREQAYLVALERADESALGESVIPKKPKEMSDVSIWRALTARRQASLLKKYNETCRKKRVEKMAAIAAFKANSGPFKSLADGMRAVARPKEEGGAATKARIGTLRTHADLLDKPLTTMEDTPNWIAWVEEDLLGIPLSCSQIDACDISQVNCSCKEYISGRSGYLIFGVNIESVKETKTKRGKTPGRKMCRLFVTDGTAAIEAVVFPETYKEFAHLLTEGNNIIFQGERKEGSKDFDESLIVSKVWQANR